MNQRFVPSQAQGGTRSDRCISRAPTLEHRAAILGRLGARLPYTGSLMVVGECRYGVPARPNQGPFLLHAPDGEFRCFGRATR